MIQILTGHTGACPEDFEYLRVELDPQVAFVLDLGVPFCHDILHPVAKWLANDGVDDVDDILPEQFVDLTILNRESPLDLWVFLRPLEYIRDGQLVK